MFTSIVLWAIFIGTSFLVPFVVYALLKTQKGINWFNVAIFFGIWFMTGRYLLG